MHNYAGFVIETTSSLVHFLTFLNLKSDHRWAEVVTKLVCTSIIFQFGVDIVIFSNSSAEQGYAVIRANSTETRHITSGNLAHVTSQYRGLVTNFSYEILSSLKPSGHTAQFPERW